VGEKYSELGRICVAQEKYEEAIALFRKAIDTNQQIVGSDRVELVPDVFQLARALWRNGERAEAQTTMARAVTLERLGAVPDPVGNDEWLLYQGDFAAAASGFRARAAREIPDPEGMPVWEKLAEAEEALGNIDAARDAYLQAAAQWEQRLSPGHPRANWCRARAALLPCPQAHEIPHGISHL
jgi:tetratricopeptide (TPR) repeat protein